MTIPQVVMHAGQQMYLFDEIVDGPQGPLVKWSCMYCGGGDYILSAFPIPRVAEDEFPSDEFPSDEFPLDDFTSPSPTPLEFTTTVTRCCDETPPASTPEPSAAALLSIGLAIGVLLRRWRYGRSNRSARQHRSVPS